MISNVFAHPIKCPDFYSRPSNRDFLNRLHNGGPGYFNGTPLNKHNFRDVIRARSFMGIKVRESLSHLFSS